MSEITLKYDSKIIICYGMRWDYVGSDKNEVVLTAKLFKSKFFSQKGLKIVACGNEKEPKSLIFTHESLFSSSYGDCYDFNPDLLENFLKKIPECQKILNEIREQFDQYKFSDYKIIVCVSWENLNY